MSKSKKDAAPAAAAIELLEGQKAYVYNGTITGGYNGLGYVEPGKVILVQGDYAQSIVDKAPEGTFTLHRGALQDEHVAKLPSELLNDSVPDVAAAAPDDAASTPAEAPATEGDAKSSAEQ